MNITNTFDDGVLVESFVDHGDGTGTHTDFSSDPPTVTQVSGLHVQAPEETPADPMATLLGRLAEAQSLEEVRDAAAEAQAAL